MRVSTGTSSCGPRLTVAASIELGAGIWVNVVDPVAAAGELMAAVG